MNSTLHSGRKVEFDRTLRGAFLAAAEKMGNDFLKEIFDDKGNFRDDRIFTINGRLFFLQ